MIKYNNNSRFRQQYKDKDIECNRCTIGMIILWHICDGLLNWDCGKCNYETHVCLFTWVH